MSMQPKDKIMQFTSLLQHMRKDLRLGGIVGLYQLLISKSVIGGQIRPHVRNVLIEELFTCLAAYESQETLLLVAALELIGKLGPNDRSVMRIGVLKALVSEPS